MDWDESILAGAERLELPDGASLRLLTAMEALQARREAAELARDDRERALCSNACLLARALERDGKAVFASGEAVLEGLRVEDIARLARLWAGFDRQANPSARLGETELEPIKKVWSARLRSAFNGACSGIFGRCRRRNGSGG